MGYPRTGGFLAFFKPMIAVAGTSSIPLAAVDIGASSGTHGEWVCFRACTVKQLQFILTLEAASGTSVAPTVVYKKYLIPGSSSGAVTLGTLTVPTGTAIGKTVYKNITPVKMVVGQSIQITWTVGTGTPTGMGEAELVAEADEEVPGNNSSMIASA